MGLPLTTTTSSSRFRDLPQTLPRVPGCSGDFDLWDAGCEVFDDRGVEGFTVGVRTPGAPSQRGGESLQLIHAESIAGRPTHLTTPTGKAKIVGMTMKRITQEWVIYTLMLLPNEKSHWQEWGSEFSGDAAEVAYWSLEEELGACRPPHGGRLGRSEHRRNSGPERSTLAGGVRVKIRMQVYVEVDPKEWDADFGCGAAVTKVDADVRQYIENALRWTYAGENGLMTIDVAAR